MKKETMFSDLELKYIRILAVETLNIHKDNEFADLNDGALRAIQNIVNKSDGYLNRKGELH